MFPRRSNSFAGFSLFGFALLAWLAVGIAQEEADEPTAAEAEEQVEQPAAEQPAAQAEPQHVEPAETEQSEPVSHEQAMQECLRMCRECAQICNRTSWYAYRQGRAGGAEMARVQQLTGDCQAFCELSARMMERHSPLMAEACGACEKACLACLEACEQAVQSAGGQHQLIADCAEKCRQCAESCRNMVATMSDEGHSEHEHH